MFGVFEKVGLIIRGLTKLFDMSTPVAKFKGYLMEDGCSFLNELNKTSIRSAFNATSRYTSAINTN